MKILPTVLFLQPCCGHALRRLFKTPLLGPWGRFPPQAQVHSLALWGFASEEAWMKSGEKTTWHGDEHPSYITGETTITSTGGKEIRRNFHIGSLIMKVWEMTFLWGWPIFRG